MEAYHYNFLFACIGVTLLVAFFTIGVPNANAVGTSIACYYLVAAAILILAGQSAATITNLSTGIVKMLPFLSIFGIVMYSGILMSLYFDQIASNKVSEYYCNFSKVSIILIMIQVGVFLRTLYNRGIDGISRKTMAILGLLGTVNLITVITLGITLKYYTTDC